MNNKLIISHIKGGFGNQLHQYGTGLAFALKLNAKFKVDLSFFEQEKYKHWYKLDKVNVELDLATCEEIELLKNKPDAPLIYRVLKKIGINSKYRKNSDIVDTFGFKPDKRILNLNDSAYISGWCAKEIYVREIRTKLIQQFKPIAPLTSCAQDYMDLIKDTNSVSIHIRRGDYLDLDHFFRVIPIDYYKAAITQIIKTVNNPSFFIFSNDINWVKENFDFINDPIFVDHTKCRNYSGYADIEEYELMKNCKHNIIGNSSFSWWAAYLNQNNNKIVIAPKKWFNDKFYQESFEQYPICPSNWNLI